MALIRLTPLLRPKNSLETTHRDEEGYIVRRGKKRKKQKKEYKGV